MNTIPGFDDIEWTRVSGWPDLWPPAVLVIYVLVGVICARWWVRSVMDRIVHGIVKPAYGADLDIAMVRVLCFLGWPVIVPLIAAVRALGDNSIESLIEDAVRQRAELVKRNRREQEELDKIRRELWDDEPKKTTRKR